jgi:leucyl/phenylalanyl-tRNA--protein transferase
MGRPVLDAVPSLSRRGGFPDPRTARTDGLVAIGGDLSVKRLLEAYKHGIFPWTADPVTWWSPDPRAIFDLDTIHIPRRLMTTIRRMEFDVTFDTAFDQVIEACATVPRWGDETWITPEFIEAYQSLHRGGHAHSIELWQEGELAAGVYGVSIGGFFAGESMFHHVANASKIALVFLQRHLYNRGFRLFDTQMLTPVTELMGARHISRDEYLVRLEAALEVNAEF